MVKHTQTIYQQFADELFECVWPFCGVGPYMVKVGSFSQYFIFSKCFVESVGKDYLALKYFCFFIFFQ